MKHKHSELKKSHKSTALNVQYFGYRQVAIEKHFQRFPSWKTEMMQRYNDLAGRIDARLCMAEGEDDAALNLCARCERPFDEHEELASKYYRRTPDEMQAKAGISFFS